MTAMADERPDRAVPSEPGRLRGFSAPQPPGGEDPQIEQTRVEERRSMRLLLLMVGLIVGIGLVMTLVAGLIEPAAGH